MPDVKVPFEYAKEFLNESDYVDKLFVINLETKQLVEVIGIEPDFAYMELRIVYPTLEESFKRLIEVLVALLSPIAAGRIVSADSEEYKALYNKHGYGAITKLHNASPEIDHREENLTFKPGDITFDISITVPQNG